jgi:fatty acid-binding protein DegV
VYVIDSLNLSTGIGHLVLDAAELAGEGSSRRNSKDNRKTREKSWM